MHGEIRPLTRLSFCPPLYPPSRLIHLLKVERGIQQNDTVSSTAQARWCTRGRSTRRRTSGCSSQPSSAGLVRTLKGSAYPPSSSWCSWCSWCSSSSSCSLPTALRRCAGGGVFRDVPLSLRILCLQPLHRSKNILCNRTDFSIRFLPIIFLHLPINCPISNDNMLVRRARSQSWQRLPERARKGGERGGASTALSG